MRSHLAGARGESAVSAKVASLRTSLADFQLFLELHFGGQTLGLAFANAQLLADLLRVPNDPYRMQVRRNALLMYPPAARGQVEIVLSCLRT